jgi:haloalkane dehalogenase
VPRRNWPSILARITGDSANPTPFPKRRHVDVLGARVSYIQEGAGSPILFLHGGIASAHLWRRPMAYLAPQAVCIAVDSIGTGDSGRLLPNSPDSYRLGAQLAYLEAFVEVSALHEPITLVLHGWGSMVGFLFAQRHADRIRGICHMESVVRPLEWDDLPPPLRDMLEKARSEKGGHFVMETDEYFDLAVRRETVTPMGKAMVDEYRKALGRQGEMRQALLTTLREIPIGGEPSSSAQVVQDYSRWLRITKVPKLLILGEPGYLMTGAYRKYAEGLPNQTVVRVSGAHLLPEDSPDGVGTLLRSWYRSLDA